MAIILNLVCMITFVPQTLAVFKITFLWSNLIAENINKCGRCRLQKRQIIDSDIIGLQCVTFLTASSTDLHLS